MQFNVHGSRLKCHDRFSPAESPANQDIFHVPTKVSNAPNPDAAFLARHHARKWPFTLNIEPFTLNL